MSKLIFKAIITAALILSTITACAANSSQFKNEVGKNVVASIEKSTNIVVAKVAPDRKPPFHIVSKEKQLSQKQAKQLRELLLDDSHYKFGLKKLCIFIPTSAYTFKGDNDVTVYVSKNCKEIYLSANGKNVFLNYDPMADKVDALTAQFTKNLLSNQ